MPTTTQEVVRLFAIASRAACAKPEALEEIHATLGEILSRLIPPEQIAGKECAQIWARFARSVESCNEGKAEACGKEMLRGLEVVCGNLGLAPLGSWSMVTDGIEEKNHVKTGRAAARADSGDAFRTVRKNAKAKARKRADPPLKAPEVLRILSKASLAARREVFDKADAAGALDRNDQQVVTQVINQGGKVVKGEDMLITALERIGRWLAR